MTILNKIKNKLKEYDKCSYKKWRDILCPSCKNKKQGFIEGQLDALKSELDYRIKKKILLKTKQGINIEWDEPREFELQEAINYLEKIK